MPSIFFWALADRLPSVPSALAWLRVVLPIREARRKPWVDPTDPLSLAALDNGAVSGVRLSVPWIVPVLVVQVAKGAEAARSGAVQGPEIAVVVIHLVIRRKVLHVCDVLPKADKVARVFLVQGALLHIQAVGVVAQVIL